MSEYLITILFLKIGLLKSERGRLAEGFRLEGSLWGKLKSDRPAEGFFRGAEGFQTTRRRYENCFFQGRPCPNAVLPARLLHQQKKIKKI